MLELSKQIYRESKVTSNNRKFRQVSQKLRANAKIMTRLSEPGRVKSKGDWMETQILTPISQLLVKLYEVEILNAYLNITYIVYWMTEFES